MVENGRYQGFSIEREEVGGQVLEHMHIGDQGNEKKAPKEAEKVEELR